MTLYTDLNKAPFPAFGGKSRIAAEVWSRFGNVRNYVEPFAFSAAVLLKRPGGPGAVETINDRNAFVTNFWRAVRSEPDAVAEHADWPVIEDDLHARHRWLVASDEAVARLDRVREDPEYFDAKIAGWWCWGACCWIGSGWCDETQQLPHMTGSQGLTQKLPHMTGSQGLTQKLPHMDAAGRLVLSPNDRRPGMSQAGLGVNAGGKIVPLSLVFGQGITCAPDDSHRPQLADEFSRGRGVNGGMDLTACGQRREWITRWMLALADRLRPVRVCCGHWSRVCDSPSTMTRLGLTGVFLDPPYRVTLACGKANRTKYLYANDRNQDVNALCDEVQEWCLRWGTDPEVRIALCGLEGEYPAIEAAGWKVHAWKSNGGYGNKKGGNENENARRERVWFSPHCITPHTHHGLFGVPIHTEAS